MASNGGEEAFAPSDVLRAVMTMRGGEQDSKKQAHEYLERFQKSVGPVFNDSFGKWTNGFRIERFMGDHFGYSLRTS